MARITKEEYEKYKTEYVDAYLKANKTKTPPELSYWGGWVTIKSSYAESKVRARELPELTETLKRRIKPFREKFLDYVIVNSWNGDGFVLLKEDVGLSYECHLGNYSTAQDAKDSAILYFMIARPEKFHSSIFHRLIGTKTYHEWFTFKKVVEEEGLEMPKEVYCRGTNCTIATTFPSFVKSTEWEKKDNGN